jgi:hypothetical protein
LAIPARITSSGEEPNSYKELVAEIAKLRESIKSLSARLGQRDARIAELERLLDESRRSGKRQAAPFSKASPVEEPAKPGRKRGDAHGRHGHRMAPGGSDRPELSAPLPSCCPDCGGELELERTAEQFQVDLPPPRPVVTRVNLPALTDGASDPSARLELLGTTVFTPPRPIGLAPRDRRMIGLAFARTPRFLSTRPGSGRYSGLSPFGTAPCGVPPSGLLTSV